MNHDQLVDTIQNVIDDYTDRLEDLNDVDTLDLAENIALAIQRAQAD